VVKLILAGVLASLVGAATGADLGRLGPTYPIAEPDMIEAIKAELRAKQASGELDRYQNDAVTRAKASINNPPIVAGLVRAAERRTFHFDPSVRVDESLVDHQGNVVVPAGSVVNPLDYSAFNQVLLFIDGRDADQVAYAQRMLATDPRLVKPILVAGSPPALMEASNRRVYFDQQGLLTQRFGILRVPATVRRDGNRLLIEEVPPK
jgi:conjugal transfer pilus assembly protein TraW